MWEELGMRLGGVSCNYGSPIPLVPSTAGRPLLVFLGNFLDFLRKIG